MSVSEDELPEVRGYARWQVAVSAIIGVAVAVLSVWWVSGFTVAVESLYRVSPTVQDSGVGSDWVAANTIPALDFLIALIHAADVILGAFILVLFFLHWAAFRRLASQMRQPDEEIADGVATDGGVEGGDRQ
ncbi:hypothetical protein BRD09_06050 [Halobacteriales archaeon SW_10_68_16]|jgi:hypothetical protein|nr:MAG: hypothetical protein BRD09_06050 [Halobacteriales archaeon SW_10_68_16]